MIRLIKFIDWSHNVETKGKSLRNENNVEEYHIISETISVRRENLAYLSIFLKSTYEAFTVWNNQKQHFNLDLQ